MSKMSKMDWDISDTLKMTKVPHAVNTVLQGLKSRWSRRGLTEEERAKKVAQQVNRASLEYAIPWLLEHKDYLFTYRERDTWGRGDHRVFMVAAKPQVKYESCWGSRGLGSTYRRNAFVLKDKWLLRAEAALKVVDGVKAEQKRQRYEQQLRNLETQVKQSEERLGQYPVDEEFIRSNILKTLRNFARGQSNSTHGTFSFGLGHATHYINKETGEVLPFEGSEYGVMSYDRITQFPEDMQPDVAALMDRVKAVRKVQHERSILWKRVFDDILGRLEVDA